MGTDGAVLAQQGFAVFNTKTVSYTHLDVYKRQPLDSVKEQCQMYEERRDALCQGLRDIGWELPNGKGTMFVWAKIPGGRTDSMAFCMELMEKAGVIVTPGADVYKRQEDFLPGITFVES